LIERLESLPQDAEVLTESAGSFEMHYVSKVEFDEDYGGVVIE
jgi:hypothetical protein